MYATYTHHFSVEESRFQYTRTYGKAKYMFKDIDALENDFWKDYLKANEKREKAWGDQRKKSWRICFVPEVCGKTGAQEGKPEKLTAGAGDSSAGNDAILITYVNFFFLFFLWHTYPKMFNYKLPDIVRYSILFFFEILILKYLIS